MSLGSLHQTTGNSFMSHPRLIACLMLGFLWCAAQPGQAQPGPLSLFKNYFVTGDYAVAGVGMRGKGVLDSETGEKWATATISMTDVPENADILAAFLYWATLQSSDVAQDFAARGFFNGLEIVGKSLPAVGNSDVAGCWGSGGGSGTTSPASPLKVYRANVLAGLPYPSNPPNDPDGIPVGKRQANGSHTVMLRDSGGGGTQVPQSGNQTFLTEGATLVVVWRRPDSPLRGVTIYDGAYTANQDNKGAMSQEIKGFYQAIAGTDARMTHIVSNGNTNFGDKLTVNGVVPSGVSPTNAFQHAQGQAWDNLTFNVSLAANASSVTTAVAAVGSSVDCLSWGAIIFSTKVKDTDWDGLLDVWETGNTPQTYTCQNFNPSENHGPPLVDVASATNQTLPDLHAMGANPCVQDIFIQVAYLKTTGPTTYGLGTSAEVTDTSQNGHTHLPDKSVFDYIAALLETAPPRRNPAAPSETCSSLPSANCITGAIKVHFDVGDNYQGPAYVPSTLAEGGQYLLESEVVSTTGGPPKFLKWPGTVGWKSGFLKVWEDLLPGSPAFDPNRRHIFRRALFAHAIGIQDKDKPEGTPRSVSGVADAGNGGGDFMVTLGLWDGFTGSQFVQTSTTLHEMVHLFGIRHGGAAPQPPQPGFPNGIPSFNCKPNYQSIANYFFQIQGLPGQPIQGPLGQNAAVIDLSRQVLQTLNENSLPEVQLTDGNGGAMLYPTRWFVPVGALGKNTLDATVGATPATKTCTGQTPVSQTMVRVSGTSATAPIDWNLNGVGSAVSQDVNFNEKSKVLDGTLEGFNDWLNLDLRQGASRRNRTPGDILPGLSASLPVAWSLEVAENDVAQGDPGFGDPGFGDPGFGDPGFGDPGFGDPGFGDPGFGDPGFGDPGFGDPGFGDPGFGGDLDFERATDLAGAPYITGFTTTNQAIILTWSAPPVGRVSKYVIWRATGAITPNNQPRKIGETNGNTLTFADTSSRNNINYSYVVTAVVQGKNSGPSNILFPARR